MLLNNFGAHAPGVLGRKLEYNVSEENQSEMCTHASGVLR